MKVVVMERPLFITNTPDWFLLAWQQSLPDYNQVYTAVAMASKAS